MADLDLSDKTTSELIADASIDSTLELMRRGPDYPAEAWDELLRRQDKPGLPVVSGTRKISKRDLLMKPRPEWLNHALGYHDWVNGRCAFCAIDEQGNPA